MGAVKAVCAYGPHVPLVPAARLVFSVPVALALHLGAVVVCPPAGVGTAAAERPGVSLG